MAPEEMGELAPADLAEHALVVTFDYEVEGEPLQVTWPVTKREAERVHDYLSRYSEGDEAFVELEVNRVRRDVWINLGRVREVYLVEEYFSSAGLPTTLEKETEEVEEDRDLDIPLDLYPLAVLAFRGSEHSYGAAARWLALNDLSPDEAVLIPDGLSLDEGSLFLRFLDDDGEYRFLRKHDLAFVDVARIAEGEDGELRFVAEA